MAELCTGPALHGKSLGAPNEPDHPADQMKLLLQGRTGLQAVCLSSSCLPGCPHVLHAGATASGPPQLYTLRCSEPGVAPGCRAESADVPQVLRR